MGRAVLRLRGVTSVGIYYLPGLDYRFPTQEFPFSAFYNKQLGFLKGMRAVMNLQLTARVQPL